MPYLILMVNRDNEGISIPLEINKIVSDTDTGVYCGP